MDSQCCILLDMQPQQGCYMHAASHGLRTPNEGINQRNLLGWQTKYALAVPKNLGMGVDFCP